LGVRTIPTVFRSQLVGRALAALTPTGLVGCSGGVLDPQGPVGRTERLILLDSTAIMLAVIIPVILMTIGVAWWFRAGNRRAEYLPDWEHSGRIELIVWFIPALIILFLGGVAWVGSHDLDPPVPLKSPVAALEVNVVSVDWRWIFIYPDQGIASVNELRVPSGVPVHFRITSTSVMNSFFVPQLGSQIYAMPGMTTQLNLLAEHPGMYEGMSSQFSGDGFSDMRFALIAVRAAEFAAWISSVHQSGGTLDAASFSALAKPARAQGVVTFGAVSKSLFDLVASGKPTMSMTQQKEP
jgi:cytochrome o ubiquinol oxidase subunit 2